MTDSPGELNETITRHVRQVDQRLAALGRHRERMITVRESLSNGSPSDEELLDLMDELAQVDHGLTQRLTLLVYNDIEAVHDHLVAGATVVAPPRDMPYGVREYSARDLEGGLWSFMTPLEMEGDPL